MHVKTVTVSYGRTFNLDDYESLRLDTSMEVEFDETDQTPEIGPEIDNMWSAVKNMVKAQALPVLKVRDEKRKRLAGQAETYRDVATEGENGE